MDLMMASRQWAERPADETYYSLADLHAAVALHRQESKEAKNVAFSDLRVEKQDESIVLIGNANIPSKLTNWSFGQLCQRVGAPASYMRELPPTLAAQNLNYGLKEKTDGETANVLLRANGSYTVRAFTSEMYSRIWNTDITARLIRLTQQNPSWQPAPEAFAMEGQEQGSRGLYASDRDMFAFLVDNDRRIFEKDPHGGMSRGFFCWNSEVGAKSFGVMSFLYKYICGNHIVWGASSVKELRLRHVGNADERAFAELTVELKKYSDSSVSEEEGRIESAMQKQIAGTKEEVLDTLFGLKVPGLTRALITDGYQKAEEHEDWYGNPRSVWGVVNGITEAAKEISFTDQRVEVERAAGKLLEMTF